MPSHQLLIWTALLFLGADKIHALSLGRADLYDSTKEGVWSAYVLTSEGLRKAGHIWDKKAIMEEMTLDSVLEVEVIGKEDRKKIRDLDTLLKVIAQQGNAYSKIDFVYNTRISKSEKEFIWTQISMWTLLFSIIELRHPLHEKNPQAYNWRMPFYGFAFGSILSVSLTFSYEKRRVHLDWKNY